MLASYHERGSVAPIRGDGVVRAPLDGVSAAAQVGRCGPRPESRPRCKHGATGMASRLLMLVALVVVIAATWAALVTLFLPPLTLGRPEFYKAMVRRWVRNTAVLGVGTVLVFVLWVLFLARRCSLFAS